MKKLVSTALALSLLMLSGCAMIAGKEDSSDLMQQSVMPRFVESLRSEQSLRGEGWKEPQHGTPPATFLQQPNSVFADAFRVYVTDTYMSSSVTSPRVIVFDRGERTMKVLAIPVPPAEGKLIAPAAVAVDPANVIFVADSQQGMVFGYDLKGTLFTVLGRAGDVGKPVALAVDHARGRLYVADASGRRVKVFSILGNPVATLGDPSNPDEDFRLPAAIAIDKNGRLYVLDSRGKRVYVYDPDRKFVQRFSLRGGTEGSPVQPRGIAVDSEGHVYVPDMFSNNVLIYDRDGTFVRSWGRTGSMIGEFWSPTGIFIDGRDQVYIADQMNSRIQVFQLPKPPVPVQ